MKNDDWKYWDVPNITVPYQNENVLYDPERGPASYGYRTEYFDQEDNDYDNTRYLKTEWERW